MTEEKKNEAKLARGRFVRHFFVPLFLLVIFLFRTAGKFSFQVRERNWNGNSTMKPNGKKNPARKKEEEVRVRPKIRQKSSEWGGRRKKNGMG